MTKSAKKPTTEPAASWQLQTAKARFSEVFLALLVIPGGPEKE